jgi:mRNA interferase HigB
MRIITKKKLADFWEQHADAKQPLEAWYRLIEANNFSSLNDLKLVFRSADYVPPCYVVFDIGGNKYRLICAIHYNVSRVFVREVFTHAQYDRWKPRN